MTPSEEFILNVGATLVTLPFGGEFVGLAREAWVARTTTLTRIYSTASSGGGVARITLAEAEAAARAAGIDMRMFQLAYEAGPHYGFISQTGAGALVRAADGRIVLTLQDAGLNSTRAAVETIAHELNHVRGILRTGLATDEAAAEAAARAAGQFSR